MHTSLLLDTNVYCNFFIPINQRNQYFSQLETILDSEKTGVKGFYIAEITSMEIYSAIGKYARGKEEQIVNCNRQIIDSQNQEQNCHNRWLSAAVTSLSKRQVQTFLSQIDNAQNQRGDIQAHILPFTSEAIHEGKRLLRQYATKFALGSHDAFIAGFLIAANKEGKNLSLVTFDKALKNVMKLENQSIIEFS
jgi:predicted nucleic acid-binding protein